MVLYPCEDCWYSLHNQRKVLDVTRRWLTARGSGKQLEKLSFFKRRRLPPPQQQQQIPAYPSPKVAITPDDSETIVDETALVMEEGRHQLRAEGPAGWCLRWGPGSPS